MYTISKMFAFSASHQLHGLPLEHPCSRLHGHNYEIIVELRADTLNNVGFVKDYRELDGLKIYIDDVLDHRDLNNVLHFNPTAENIARHLFEEFKITIPQLYAITVKETPKTAARYEFTPKIS